MIILNEVKEAELILKNADLSFCDVTKMINLLIRYFINNKGYSEEAAINETVNHIKKYRAGFTGSQWKTTMEKIAKSAHSKPLRNIESVPVTQKEIDKINELPTDQCKKVAFTYLVLAKMNYISYRHLWVNTADTEIMCTANINHNFDDFYKVLNILYTSEYVTPARSMLKTSIEVNFADVDGEPKFNVNHLMNLGLWWEYINGANYRFCVDCGMIFKPKSGSHIHCNKHKKSLVCVCIDCGRSFDIPEGGRIRKRCECCNREFYLKYRTQKKREERARKKKNS